MARRKEIEWLLNELPGLTASGVLSPEAAERLRRHYAEQLGGHRTWLGVIFTAIGALLIGGGVVSLLAYNWEQLSRPLRAALAYLPLLAGQIGAGWVLAKAETRRTAVREGWGTFLFLAMGACLGLIAQTYHLGGRFDTFLLVWMLLGLPVAFVLEAVLPALLTMVGVTFWSFMWKEHGGSGLWIWPLGAAAMASVGPLLRREDEAPRTALATTAAALMLLVAVGLTLAEIDNPSLARGAAYILYLTAGSALYLLAECWQDLRWQRVFAAPGRVGGLVVWVIVLALTFRRAWIYGDIIAPPALLSMMKSEPLSVQIATGILFAIITVSVAGALVAVVRKGQHAALWMGVAPIVYVAAMLTENSAWGSAIMNVYVLAAGVAGIVLGVRARNGLRAYTGLATVALLIWFRFFDVDLGFVARGIVFIVLGICFIVAQRILSRHMREAS